jgi:hypothetical protein
MASQNAPANAKRLLKALIDRGDPVAPDERISQVAAQTGLDDAEIRQAGNRDEGPGTWLVAGGQADDRELGPAAQARMATASQGGSIFGTPIASQASTSKRAAQSSKRRSISCGYAAPALSTY